MKAGLMWNCELNLLDVTLPTPEENLALDEALLVSAEEQKAGACLRLWESSQWAVILGSSNRVEEEVWLETCEQDGIPVLRRCTGGGSVLIGPGSLVFTLVMPITPEQHLSGISAATAAVLERMIRILGPVVPGISMEGTSDLAIEGLKVSGNSQRWLRTAFLHHGTLLYNFPIGQIGQYLRLPQRQPEYRNERAHDEFLTNFPISRGRLRELLIEGWHARPMDDWLPLEQAQGLADEKYCQAAWNLRR